MSSLDQLLDELAAESRLTKAEIIQVFAQVNAEQDQQQFEDAEKWRALMACQRMTVGGFAGLVNPLTGNHAHITVNLWSASPALFENARDSQNTEGRKDFARFIEIAVENYRK